LGQAPWKNIPQNGWIGFTATVLGESTAMLPISRKRQPNLRTTGYGGSQVILTMDFA
jgi:hypothetical protein